MRVAAASLLYWLNSTMCTSYIHENTLQCNWEYDSKKLQNFKQSSTVLYETFLFSTKHALCNSSRNYPKFVWEIILPFFGNLDFFGNLLQKFLWEFYQQLLWKFLRQISSSFCYSFWFFSSNSFRNYFDDFSNNSFGNTSVSIFWNQFWNWI